MTKLYFFNGTHHGHVYPTLGPVQELVRRGHELIYFADETFRAAVERTGAVFRTYDLQPPRESIAEADQFAAYLLEYSAALLPGLLERARADKPDCVIFDMLRPWGWLLGRALDVPVICSSPSFVLTAPVLEAVAPEFLRSLNSDMPSESTLAQRQRFAAVASSIRTQFGLDSPSLSDVLAMRGDATLVFTTRRMQPSAQILDSSIHFVGPSLHGRHDAADLVADRPQGRRTVFISLGTIFNDRLEFFRNCIHAFADADYVVTMAVGRARNVELSGELPANFCVREFVPQLQVLQQTDVFFTHGGMGSVHEALSYGVPMLLYPQTIEQSIVARQIASQGAGVQLTSVSGASGLISHELIAASEIREAVDRVIHDASFAHHARRLAREFPPETPALFADVVDRFLSRGDARAA